MEEKKDITTLGNPRKPEGEYGVEMLKRMNDSHYELTGWALSYFDIEGKYRVLDIGCGGGITLRRMAEKVEGGHLTGVDYSDVSVSESKKLNEDLIAAGKMNIEHASVEDLPFDEGAFDKIITVESFYFWPTPQESLKEVFRVLSTGGSFMLVAEVYDKEGMSEKHREEVARYEMTNPSIDGFKEFFANAGFKDVEIHLKDGTDWICVIGHK